MGQLIVDACAPDAVMQGFEACLTCQRTRRHHPGLVFWELNWETGSSWGIAVPDGPSSALCDDCMAVMVKTYMRRRFGPADALTSEEDRAA